MSTQATIDNTGLNYRQAEQKVRATAKQLGIDPSMIEDLALAACAYVKATTLGGYPMVVTAQVMRKPSENKEAYEVGSYVMGRVFVRTPDNQSTSGFGEIFFSKHANSQTDAVNMWAALSKRIEKDGK